MQNKNEYKIETTIPPVEDILDNFRDAMAENYQGYRNHVYRMLHFCFALMPDATLQQREKFIIAAAFHDMGLWTENTVDYLPPSIVLAREYLQINKLEDYIAEVELMIDMHHKLTAFRDENYPLVEIFRRADLADFSLGLVKGGVPTAFIKKVKATFPNAGFHKTLLRIGTWWGLRHPLNPAPIMKW